LPATKAARAAAMAAHRPAKPLPAMMTFWIMMSPGWVVDGWIVEVDWTDVLIQSSHKRLIHFS
jgi:hypothetical protein